MLPQRSKYLIGIAAIALLAGALLLWRGQSIMPAGSGSAGTSALESAVREPDAGTARATTTAASSSVSQAVIDQTADTPGSVPNVQAIARNNVQATDTPSATATGSTPARDQSPPTEPNTPRLSPRVFDVISEVQERQLAGQWEEALNEMNALYHELDTLNPFEQATLLNFYTNTLLRMEMWQESITAFNMILQVPDLRPDVNARALLALGQLHARVGEGPEGAAYLQEWLNYTNGMENMGEMTPRVNSFLTCLQGSSDASASCTF